MNGLPQVTVIGTLTSDPELRYTASGAAVVTFTIASNARKLNKNTNTWEDSDPTFLRCNLWRQAAENVSESLLKGTRVIAAGSLKQRSFETREGEKRTVFELEVDEVGPSLKWATAKVAKVSRTAGDTSGGSQDPWGSAPTPTGPSDDEPPF